MPRRLPPFVQSILHADHADQVLNAAHKVAYPPLNMLAAWRMRMDGQDHHMINTRNILYHSSVPEKFRQQHRIGMRDFGLSPMAQLATTNDGPFTFTEARLRINPTGGDQWIFDLLMDYGMRDGFYYSSGPWVVVYWAANVLKLTEEARVKLVMTSAGVTYRLQKLASKRKRSATKELPKLTTREIAVLQHMAQGMKLTQVAKKLELSPHTVIIYQRGIRKKLKAKTITEAVAIGVRKRVLI